MTIYHKRHQRRKKASISALAKRVRELEVDEERKFLDAPPLTPALHPQLSGAAVAVPTIINTVLQDGSRSGRNGSKIDLTSLQIDFWYRPKSCLNINDLATLDCDPMGILLRLLVVWFPSIPADDPAAHPTCVKLTTLNNVLENPGIVQSFYKRDGQVNYKVLCDRTHKVEFGIVTPVLPATDVQWAPLSGSDFRVKKTIPLNKQCTYESVPLPAVSSAAPRKGVLVYYVIAEATQALLDISLGTYDMYTRLTWTDD